MTRDRFDADCIVVGSGPAGVSVTFPLLERGARVLMIDGDSEENSFFEQNVVDRRKQMLGTHLEALLPEDGLSPKLRTPAARQIASNFIQATNLRSDSFVAIGAKARGGLSRIWGGFVSEFDSQDMGTWPFPSADLQPSYKIVTERIGVSGSATDDMATFYGCSGTLQPALPLGMAAARLFSAYKPGSCGSEFALGHARNAILTIDRTGRQACNLRKDCLWGCQRGAIYDARIDLLDLKRSKTFQLLENAFATRIAKSRNGWTVLTQDGRSFAAPRIALAAGTLGTAALVIPLLSNIPAQLRLLNNPVFAMPLIVASLHRSLYGHSLAQLGYRLRHGDAPTDYVTGAVYEVDGLPAASFTARLPFGRRAGGEFFRAISPALLVATGYFPATCSDNKLEWRRDGDQLSMLVRGGVISQMPSLFRIVTRNLRKIWWRLGAFTLPGTSLATAGTDAHYAGLFAMGRQTPCGSSPWGELNSATGIYITDGAAIPTMPSKHPTLTIMANADRIGRHLARLCATDPT